MTREQMIDEAVLKVFLPSTIARWRQLSKRWAMKEASTILFHVPWFFRTIRAEFRRLETEQDSHVYHPTVPIERRMYLSDGLFCVPAHPIPL